MILSDTSDPLRASETLKLCSPHRDTDRGRDTGVGRTQRRHGPDGPWADQLFIFLLLLYYYYYKYLFDCNAAEMQASIQQAASTVVWRGPVQYAPNSTRISLNQLDTIQMEGGRV